MKWKTVKDDGLPAYGEKVLLISNGALQNSIYECEEHDLDLYSKSYWTTEHVDLHEESFDIKDNDQWCYMFDVPTPYTK